MSVQPFYQTTCFPKKVPDTFFIGVEWLMSLIGPMIADSARLGLGYAERLLADVIPERFACFARVGDAPIEANHPAFILGHLSLYPCRVVEQLGGDASAITPTEDELRLFSKDAKCVDDPDGSIYPPMPEITARFFAAYRTAIEAVSAADDATFQEVNPNEAMRAKFGTIGSMHAFYLGGHLMIHLGQLSTWRRASGLGPA